MSAVAVLKSCMVNGISVGVFLVDDFCCLFVLRVCEGMKLLLSDRLSKMERSANVFLQFLSFGWWVGVARGGSKIVFWLLDMLSCFLMASVSLALVVSVGACVWCVMCT